MSGLVKSIMLYESGPNIVEFWRTLLWHKVIQYCKEPRTLVEIMEHLGFTSRPQFKKHYFDELIVSGLIKRTIPEKPSSPNQKYYS